MTISARILADSVNTAGDRLTTWELKYARFIHSEFLTHRVFSRNAASSRAIPIKKMIDAVLEDPAMPVFWGRNQRGMQAAEELTGEARMAAVEEWLAACSNAVDSCRKLSDLDVHKQIANRVLEPWAHITVIASATEHQNFFKLRAHPAAQPEFQDLAYKMKKLYDEHQPTELKDGRWHLPLISDVDYESYYDSCHVAGFRPTAYEVTETMKKVSVGRCARVSYLTHDGKRDLVEDIRLHDQLLTSRHLSPFEHVAQAETGEYLSSNFIGWRQYRKSIPNESGDQDV